MSELDKIAKRIWHHSPQSHFKSYETFRAMFDPVTDRAWEAVDQSAFKTKEEFALIYWTDFQEKNLKRQERTDKSRKANPRRKKHNGDRAKV